MKPKQKISFAELAKTYANRPSPLQEFIIKVGELTATSPFSVRKWVYNQSVPEPIKQRIIADHFNIDIDSLFPTKSTH